MEAAGFHFWFEGPQLAADRFLLVFGKAKAEDISPEQDPFIAGPEIPQSPGQWLKENYWRLRGLRTADGRLVRLTQQKSAAVVDQAATESPDTEMWSIPAKRLQLTFKKKEGGYLVMDYQSLPSEDN
jgi:hypothetical protein